MRVDTVFGCCCCLFGYLRTLFYAIFCVIFFISFFVAFCSISFFARAFIPCHHFIFMVDGILTTIFMEKINKYFKIFRILLLLLLLFDEWFVYAYILTSFLCNLCYHLCSVFILLLFASYPSTPQPSNQQNNNNNTVGKKQKKRMKENPNKKKIVNALEKVYVNIRYTDTQFVFSCVYLYLMSLMFAVYVLWV